MPAAPKERVPADVAGNRAVMNAGPSGWPRRVVWGVASLLVVALAGAGFLAWKVSNTIDTVLTIGSPIAQGAGAPTAERPADIGYTGDPGEAFGYAFQSVSLDGELGPTPAWIVESSELTTKDWAIFVHGIGGRRENGYRFLPVLHDAGFRTLMLAYRGDPEAPPTPDGRYAVGLSEWRDLETAAQFAWDREAARIVLVAESMGGAIVGQFLRHSRLAVHVDAIVLDAPMIDLPATVEAVLASAGMPLPWIATTLGLRLTDLRNGTRLRDAVVLPDLMAFPGPMFLSHGEADRIVPISTSEELAGGRAGRVDYLRTDADHIQSWKVDPKRYDDALRSFLSRIGSD